MFKHIVFFIYILSAASGIIAFVYFFLQSRRLKSFLLKKYLYFFSSFSFLIFSSSIAVYLGVNTEFNTFAIHLFNLFILIGITFLLYTLPDFIHVSFNYPVNFFLKIIVPILFFLSFTFTICYWFFRVSKIDYYFIILPLIFYAAAFIYSMLIIFKNKKNFIELKKGFKTTFIIYTFFAIFFAFSETLILIKTNPKYDYPISLPLVYLSWNVISLIFNFSSATKFQKDSGLFILEELAKYYKLTPQEIKIANNILQGMSNKEIAYYLQISNHTVKNHVYNLFQKTNVQSRIELIHALYKSDK